MTSSGTFVVNGVERVVVNQMHRSQVFSLIMTKEKPTQVVNFFNCRIIPGRGSWLDFEFDQRHFTF